MHDRYREINPHASVDERRRLGRLLLIAFPCAGLLWTTITWLVAGAWHWPLWIAFAAVGIIVGGSLFFFPLRSRAVWVFWQYLTATGDIVIATVSLTILYLLVLTPVGLLMRLFGRQPVVKGPQPDAATYWKPAEKVRDPARYYRQF